MQFYPFFIDAFFIFKRRLQTKKNHSLLCARFHKKQEERVGGEFLC
jgi:hypothetical protein